MRTNVSLEAVTHTHTHTHTCNFNGERKDSNIKLINLPIE